MDEHTNKGGRLHEGRPGALGALIHQAVRRVIEVAVEEEVLLFGLVASGQIRLRRVDGWRQIPTVLGQGRRPAA